MRSKPTATAVVGALAIGAGGGYLAGATGSPQPASAQSPPAQTRSMGDPMMGRDGASMMTEMMDAEHARMMRDPAMHRLEERAMRRFPAMARMMREHMGG